MFATRLSADDAQLCALLREQAIVEATPDHPIRSRDGAPAPWMLYTWNVTLTARGAELAARSMLARLRDFESSQLVTYGMTATPLVSACVLRGGGRYTGLFVRETAKAHGAGRRVEGPADRSRPVVLIDDSLSSGKSSTQAVEILEADGFEVEGVVCVVHFPHRGGRERLESRGYRVETILDVWSDLGMPLPRRMPSWRRAAAGLRWSEEQVEDGLHPAIAARRAAEHWLQTARVLQPPARLDAEHGGRGGCWVSFRHKHFDKRVARSGFWHFDAGDADPCRDVVLATVKALREARPALTRAALDDLRIAVTWFSELEPCRPADIDFSRYGLVAHSRAWDVKVGGALPNTQVFTSDLEQLDLATRRNCRLAATEPYDLYRHDVSKCVEPGATWLAYGVPDGPELAWAQDDEVGRRLVERARTVLDAASRGGEPDGEPIPADLVSAPTWGVAVTLYHNGAAGCRITWGGTLDDCVVRATRGALQDSRYASRRAGVDPAAFSPVVSVLHEREWLGPLTLDAAARKVRLGRDTLAVQSQDGRRGLLLPGPAVHFGWSKQTFARQVLAKARIKHPPHWWTSFRTASWLWSPAGVRRLDFGYPVRTAASTNREVWRDDLEACGAYLARSLGPDGLPRYRYLPVEDRWIPLGTVARLVNGLGALAVAGRATGHDEWHRLAVSGLRSCLASADVSSDGPALRLPGNTAGVMGDCSFLLALLDAGDTGLLDDRARALGRRVLEMLRPDGRVSSNVRRRLRDDYDFLPGVALLASARYAAACPEDRRPDVAPQLQFTMRRWRAEHPWGIVGWQPQAWAAIHAATGEADHAAAVFEIIDWALDWQHAASGAFLTSLCPDGPSFHTAFLAEAVAAAWSTAIRLGDLARADRYSDSFRRAMAFASTLVIRGEDTYCMRAPQTCVGGVRGTRTSSEVRVDYVGHMIAALHGGLVAARAEQPA